MRPDAHRRRRAPDPPPFPTVFALLLVLAIVAGVAVGGGFSGRDGATTAARSASEPADDEAADDEAVSDPAFDASGREGAKRLLDADPRSAWALPDALEPAMDRLWDDDRGAYVSPGGRISTRLNAEMLRIHAGAALADHRGAARKDDRVAGLVRFLTGPAFLRDRRGVRFGGSRHNAVHVPGWRQSSASEVNQHPSIDAVAARSLRSAWLARDRVGLPDAERRAIRSTVSAVARSRAFRAPARLLNQINWNADLYAADATVTGDPTLLRRDYREQLAWFAAHAHAPERPGRTPNLSAGDGFFYRPGVVPSAPVDHADTVEYANVVLGALRYAGQADRAGMRPLPERQLRTLRGWASHVVTADWTPSGYLNWETGKGRTRIHLRQYWALALDGVVGALRGGESVTMRPASQGSLLLARGTRLFRQWALEEDTILLDAASFGFRTTFESVRRNRVTATVRFAATLADWAAGCACDGRLPDPEADRAPLRTAFDPELGRLAVNTARYATAVGPPTSVPTGGGLEPAWILDGRARPLLSLGGGGRGSLGLTLTRRGRKQLDTQPGEPGGEDPELRLRPAGEDRYTGVMTSTIGDVRVTHRFTPEGIETRYVVDPKGRDVGVTLRIPSGAGGAVQCLPPEIWSGRGCARGYLVRSGLAGMRVALRGLPVRVTSELERPAYRTMNPRPGLQATVRFVVDRRTVILREVAPLAP